MYEWVLNKAGVKRELLDTVKVKKLAYYCHTMELDVVYTCVQNLTTVAKPFHRYGWCPPKFTWFT